MTNDREPLTEQDASDGAPEWRLVDGRLHLAVEAGSFPAAVEFVGAVAEIAEAQQHHPDIDVRYDRVFLATSSHDVGALTARDVRLAQAVSAEAARRELRVVAAPLTVLSIGIDTAEPERLAAFWAALLGADGMQDHEIRDPSGRTASVWFQETDAPAEERGRTHVDVWVAADQAEARVDAALVAGGRLVSDAHAPSWWVLADPDGNLACVCTWQDAADD